MLSFFPRGVLDEILNLIESVSEGFPSYSSFVYQHSLESPMVKCDMKGLLAPYRCSLQSLKQKTKQKKIADTH